MELVTNSDSLPDETELGSIEDVVPRTPEAVRTVLSDPASELPTEWKEDLAALSHQEQAILLGMTMRSLRGNWLAPGRRLAIIRFLADTLTILPDVLTARIQWNAALLATTRVDGRIFRSGSAPTEFPKNPPTGPVTPPEAVDNDDWQGTYYEVWELGYPPEGDTSYVRHDPPMGVDADLKTYIPDDLTYTKQWETCRWRTEIPVDDDVPHEKPTVTEIAYGPSFDGRAVRIADPTEESPMFTAHVIRPRSDAPPVVIHL
ncbi:hypothetical protein RYH80_17885 [Halobaculum sp. MBLA0147]|uniref:hypothetical protein n=1 Tax=Halobaculum sp. MBLA0147 TaxID=3079934 RepID=UPI0035245A85